MLVSEMTAQIILQQIGGNKFVAMTGAKNFCHTFDSLRFKLPANFAKNGINHVIITLNADDLYDIEFLKIRGTKFARIGEIETGVYAEDLQKRFTAVTGLDTHL